MSKRPRSQSRGNARGNPLDVEDIDDARHTPKWSRSSASASPPPPSTVSSHGSGAHSVAADARSMQCILPGHSPMTLASAAEFEIHYAKEHNNQCIECRAILPSPWILELHQIENHDPLVAAKRESGEKIYQCLLQDCEKITSTPQKRRLHMIDKHQFPKNYDFRIIESGSNGRKSMLHDQKPRTSNQRRRISDVGQLGWRDKEAAMSDPSSTTSQLRSNQQTEQHANGSPKVITPLATTSKPQSELESEQSAGNDSVDLLSKKLSSLAFVPLSVQLKNRKP